MSPLIKCDIINVHIKGVIFLNKKEFKESFYQLLDNGIEDLHQSEVISYTNELLKKYEKEKFNLLWEKENYRKPWTDEELKIVLSTAPTNENILLMAKGFKRGTGSIELIYRWVSTPDKVIKAKDRDEEKFLSQLKRVAKEVGWRGY